MMLAKGTIMAPMKNSSTKFPAFPCEQAADDISADGAENHLGNHGEADDDDTVRDKGHEAEPDDHTAFRIDVGRHL